MSATHSIKAREIRLRHRTTSTSVGSRRGHTFTFEGKPEDGKTCDTHARSKPCFFIVEDFGTTTVQLHARRCFTSSHQDQWWLSCACALHFLALQLFHSDVMIIINNIRNPFGSSCRLGSNSLWRTAQVCLVLTWIRFRRVA